MRSLFQNGVLWLAAAAGLVPVSGQAGVIADFAADFSIAANPNGAWQYGSAAAPGGSLTLMTYSLASGAFLSWKPGAESFQAVALYNSATPFPVLTSEISPYEGILHPGPAGQYAVVRYTVQSPAEALLEAMVEGLDNATTDYHLLLNGSQIFGGVIASFKVPSTFSQTYSLLAGDVIELAVGYGTNNDFAFDSTGFTLRLSDAVPEPGGIGPGAAGLLLTALWRKFRRG